MECTLIEEWLEQNHFEDLCLNGSQQSWVYSQDHWNKGPTFFKSDKDLLQWLVNQLSSEKKSWDAKYPFIDFNLNSRFRIHAVLPPIGGNQVRLTIRSHKNQQSNRWASTNGFKTVSTELNHGANLLLSGATGSGKTTFISELIDQISSDRRIITLEDTCEIQSRHPHLINLYTRVPNADGFGEIGFSTLLKQTLRMRPDHIVLGECRGQEALELLQVINTGHQGTITSIHANSVRDALHRIELLAQLHSKNPLQINAIRKLISASLNLVIQLKRSSKGHEVTEICQLSGMEGDTLLLRPLLKSS